MSRGNLALIMATMAGIAAASGIPPEALQGVPGKPSFPQTRKGHSGVARMKRQAAKARRR